ncbi:hypothetical protein J7E87_17870 [Streptomyces sp. ISL-1]|uniref:hypothetical protein n=1 Tax=Streptomyces sp. ISL-1 TaxID=2817657 RepID=UPI001BE6C69D|nr:hypothetical protein [Streptomyces sp. ISL-1]MBT2391245.1 hypothetical protein [Streptomyces sp. ISL-1]
MTVTIPSLPRRQVNWWAISAGILMVGYACIALVVFALRGAVGFFVPGIDYPHPALAQQVPAARRCDNITYRSASRTSRNR